MVCYDFDLCERCYAGGRGHKKSHDIQYYSTSEDTGQGPCRPQLIQGTKSNDDNDDNDPVDMLGLAMLLMALKADDGDDVPYSFLTPPVGKCILSILTSSPPGGGGGRGQPQQQGQPKAKAASSTPDPPRFRCVFQGPYDAKNGFASAFLKVPIADGVLRWTVQVEYLTKPSYFWMGAGPATIINKFDNTDVLGEIVGSYSFFFGLSSTGELRSALLGVEDSDDIPDNEWKVPPNTAVSLELDCNAHTLAFFVGGKRVPRAVSQIPSSAPLYFGMSGVGNASFTSLSLRRLRGPTKSNIACTGYQARTPGSVALNKLIILSLLLGNKK